MLVWRICRKQYAKTAFSGIGAEQTGGRWNHPGYRMVYTSSTLSLATLELFVHVDSNLISDDLVSVSAIFPDDASIEEVTPTNLPKDWREFPAPSPLRELGTEWLESLRSLLLIVPSAVNPEEQNILINPLHPEMAQRGKAKVKPFHFDPRMWK